MRWVYFIAGLFYLAFLIYHIIRKRKIIKDVVLSSREDSLHKKFGYIIIAIAFIFFIAGEILSYIETKTLFNNAFEYTNGIALILIISSYILIKLALKKDIKKKEREKYKIFHQGIGITAAVFYALTLLFIIIFK